jgi:hypothetical protein
MGKSYYPSGKVIVTGNSAFNSAKKNPAINIAGSFILFQNILTEPQSYR